MPLRAAASRSTRTGSLRTMSSRSSSLVAYASGYSPSVRQLSLPRDVLGNGGIELVLEPGAMVTVYTGCGTPTADALYWCQTGSGVWNNGGDTAFLLDPNGNTVATRRHEG